MPKKECEDEKKEVHIKALEAMITLNCDEISDIKEALREFFHYIRKRVTFGDDRISGVLEEACVYALDKLKVEGEKE